jgi:hypothetical protein
MAQPFNYSLGVPSPMEAGQKAYQTELQSLNVQAQMQAAQAQAIAAQQKAQQEALRQQQWQEASARALSPNATAADHQRAMLLGNKEQAEAILAIFKQQQEEQNRAAISKISPVVYALHAGKPESAIATLEQQKQAHSDNPAAVQEIDGQIALIKSDPQAAQLQLGGTLSLVPGGDKVLDNLLKLTQERRAAQMGAVELRQKGAQATTAEAEAEFARKRQIAELQQKAATLGLTRAQTTQSLAQTSNLTEQGRMLALDFKAASQGLPIPSKGGGTKPAAAATEDERKAAGWLAQADNAYRNMLGAMYTKEGKPTGAEKPGIWESIAPMDVGVGISRSANRQKFVQGSESLGEAILRAATGAGVNKDEAAQKARELTPVWSDDQETREQKLAAIPMYLRSLQTRAGRAAPENYQIPTSSSARTVTVDY